MSKLNFTLKDAELDKDNNKTLIKLERENKINEAIDNVITEDTKKYYQEAVTEEEFEETLNNITSEDSVALYGTETKEDIIKNISERVKEKLNEKPKELEELKTFEDIENYLNSSENIKADRFGFHLLDNGNKANVSPKLAFDYISKNLKEDGREELKKNLEDFKLLLDIADNQGSLAIREKAEKEIAKITQEMLISAHGYKKYFMEHDILLIKSLIKGKVCNLCKHEEFPRVIPTEPLKEIKNAEDLGIFDEIVILYLDYTKENIKSNAQQIKEKDPIAFGKIFSSPGKFFYITCWIDDYCDLTLDKAIKLIKQGNPNFILPEYKGLSPKEVNDIIKKVKEREENLKNTNASNWRENYQNEINKNKKKPPFWKKLKLLVSTLFL